MSNKKQNDVNHDKSNVSVIQDTAKRKRKRTACYPLKLDGQEFDPGKR